MEKPRVRLLNDPVLRKKTEEVKSLDGLETLIPTMIEVMEGERGVGLAANQIGFTLSLFVLGVDGVIRDFINPEVVEASELVDFEEGCLSIPGTSGKTKRYNKLTLEYSQLSDNNLNTRRIESFQGLTAIAIQHELDHLNGKLYIDQFGPLKRSMVVGKHNKYLKALNRS